MISLRKNQKRKGFQAKCVREEPCEHLCRFPLADEVLCEVDGSCLKNVRVLLHFLLDDVEKGVVEDGAVDFLLAVRAAVEPGIDSEQVSVLLARDDAEPVGLANLDDVEERVMSRNPHFGVRLVVLDFERVRELRLTTLADTVEGIHQRSLLSVLTDGLFELCHIVLLLKNGLLLSKHHAWISCYPIIIELLCQEQQKICNIAVFRFLTLWIKKFSSPPKNAKS